MRSDLPLCANSARRPASMSRNYARNTKEREERRKLVRELWEAGATHEEIGLTLGVDRTMASYYLNSRRAKHA
jgi:hypothetical protein